MAKAKIASFVFYILSIPIKKPQILRTKKGHPFGMAFAYFFRRLA
jgi:hypothetical protein